MSASKTTDMTPADHIREAKGILGVGQPAIASAHALIAIAEYLALLTTPDCTNIAASSGELLGVDI